jgi:hypothetical protein
MSDPALGDGSNEVIDQPRREKSSWLEGPGDLQEMDLPIEAVGDTVTVRGLSAGQLCFIQDSCRTLVGERLEVDTVRMTVLKFAAGVVEPKFSESEANQIAHKFGPAFDLVVGEIDKMTKADQKDIDAARRRFRPRR